ncbi:MAG: hypothetical protein OXI63_22405, partial [Candidatus Poribacteria bacterium]|nr:hypothetical protein [Candidatus Poribacteria bacterium]
LIGSSSCASSRYFFILPSLQYQTYFYSVLLTHLAKNHGGTPVINTASLLNASKVIIPHLPKNVQKLMPGFLVLLPLALEIAKLLYKHRQEIRGMIKNLTKHASKQTKKISDGVAATVPRLPKKVGRKLSRRLKYLPFALEITKASYRKNQKKVQRLTISLPKKTQRKIDKLLNRHHRPRRLNFLRGF